MRWSFFHIGNTPQYAIDAYLPEELQTCYNFIFMPFFVDPYQIMGASCLYAGLVFLLMVCFVCVLVHEIKVEFK